MSASETRVEGGIDHRTLARILQFGDSVLPIGAFSFSCGVESAIQCGVVKDAASLKAFVMTFLQQAACGDGIALACALRAQQQQDYQRLLTIDQEVLCRKLNEEARQMTQRMGKKLSEMTGTLFDSPLLSRWLKSIHSGQAAGTFPVAQAIVMGEQNIDVQQVLVMHFYGAAMTIVSAAQRLMRITHLDSQQILFEVTGNIADYCAIASSADLDEMSASAPVMDVLAALHVDAHVRLFMN